MRLAPEAYRAADVRWQLFLTLTWSSTPPRAEKRDRALKQYLRRIAARARVPFDKLVWLARDGDPGRDNRPHFHVLIAGCPPASLDFDLGCYCSTAWSQHGGVEGRLWQEGLGAFCYSASDGANVYEGKRFVSTVRLTSSPNLVSQSHGLRRGDGRQEEEDAEQNDNPEVVEVLVRETGIGVHTQPELTPLATEVQGHLVCANVSKSHVALHYQRADITGVF